MATVVLTFLLGYVLLNLSTRVFDGLYLILPFLLVGLQTFSETIRPLRLSSDFLYGRFIFFKLGPRCWLFECFLIPSLFLSNNIDKGLWLLNRWCPTLVCFFFVMDFTHDFSLLWGPMNLWGSPMILFFWWLPDFVQFLSSLSKKVLKLRLRCGHVMRSTRFGKRLVHNWLWFSFLFEFLSMRLQINFLTQF